MGDNRRHQILKKLSNSTEAKSANYFAKELGVSRQVIVGDVALLRAQGHPIKATSKGYVMFIDDERFIAKIAVDHTEEETEEELRLLVDAKAFIIDVSVEHPIYGEITGQLDIKTQEDVDQFLKDIENKETELLSSLTKGVHIHTISCESKEHYKEVLKVLSDKQFLIE